MLKHQVRGEGVDRLIGEFSLTGYPNHKILSMTTQPIDWKAYIELLKVVYGGMFYSEIANEEVDCDGNLASSITHL